LPTQSVGITLLCRSPIGRETPGFFDGAGAANLATPRRPLRLPYERHAASV